MFGVKDTAVGLGAPAFPPPLSSKAYVSRGNTVQVTETLTFDAVDLTGFSDVMFSMDLSRSKVSSRMADERS